MTTISSLITPEGEGAIGVIRVSGKDAISIVNKIFFGKDLEKVDSHTVHFGTLKDNNHVIDEVLVSIFKAPKSYTGEDSVEISVHGSAFILQKVSNLLIKNGTVQAQAGEFTKRAFLNGKLDLSQAEAIADLIASSSQSSHKIAIEQMRGGFRDELKILRYKLLNISSLLELELDFGEEDIEFTSREQLLSLTKNIISKIDPLLKSFKLGNAIKKGVHVAIIGEPNVGKSTLLNALLNEDKAIVSDIAGTTRDNIEDTKNIKGINFRFIDTAGLRNANDQIEQIGIKKTYQNIDKAQIVLLVKDCRNSENNVPEIINYLKSKNKKVLILLNKIDMLENEKELNYQENYLKISAKNKTNINELEEKLFKFVKFDEKNNSKVIINNVRHYEALKKTNIALLKVNEDLKNNVTSELVSIYVKEALQYLGEITGEVTNDEILGNIFANFCIGK